MGKKSSKRAPAKRGLRGARGIRGKPGIAPKAVTAMAGTLESIQADAVIQFKRTAQLQAQLDLTLKALKEMGDKAGRHRTRR